MDLFNQKLLKQIGSKILKRHETVAVAESVTCGLIQFAFSNIPNASKFLQGGLTAYNLGQKYKHLQVEPLHAMEVNCVSGKVATEMAMHISTVYQSHWGIGITGYASPCPESNHSLFAYYAISYRNNIIKKGKWTSKMQDPAEVQLHYVRQLLRVFEQNL